MKIAAGTGKAVGLKADLMALGLPEGTKALRGEAAELDTAMEGAISDVIGTGTDFTGKLGEKTIIRPARGIEAKRVVLVGLGPGRRVGAEALRLMGGTALKECIALKADSVALLLPAAPGKRMSNQEAAQALAEGAGMGGYLFEEYRSSGQKQGPSSVKIVGADRKAYRALKSGVETGVTISESVKLARDFVNHPANVATPSMLAQQAQKLAKTSGLKAEILGPQEIEKLGMGGLMAVSAGSSQPAKVIILKHAGARSGKPVILVGKGLTFDSGGVCIKPAENMDRMKSDMAAGAAVMAALVCAGRLKLKLNVIGIVPSTENMGGASAFRPGDVLKTYDGQTIEVISTDAEGRLILADAIGYAKTMDPAAIVDMATLTGACVIALGHKASGLMGTNSALMSRIEKAATATHERVWRLPLWDDYYSQIKSDIADMKNTGGRQAGAITAGCLLSKFAGDIPWAHIDIAGTAWSEKESGYIPKGPTGVGVRLMVEMLRGWTRGG